MKESGKERFILTKSYEIAYAIFRLAANMQEKDFSERLRAGGAGLLEAATAEDYAMAERSLRVTECLIKFAGDVNLIAIANSNIILQEIYVLDVAIAESKNKVKRQEIDVAEIFSKSEREPFQKPEPAKKSEPAIIRQSAIEPAKIEEPATEEEQNQPSNINSILKSAIRQTAILDRIRQSGNCRLKDIQEILPECSERTIRYDLQTLLEQNLIERVGIAGPSVFYRVTQAA